MAVTLVKELFEGRTAEEGIDRVRRYTRRFEVQTDSALDDGTVAGGPGAGAMGLPRLGSRYPTDAFAWCKKIRPEQSGESPTLWSVICEYDTEIPKGMAQESQQVDGNGESQPGDTAADPSARPENPLDRPPQYKVSYEQSTEICEDDAAGNPITNSAGDPFDPPLEREVSYPVVTVTFAVAGINFGNLQAFQDAVNDAVWRGNPARTCRIVSIDYESAQENGVSFWKVTIRVKIRRQTWDRKVIDRGFREKIPKPGGGFTKAQIRDPTTGAFPTDPRLLDGNGRKLGDGNGPQFLTFRVYPEKDFTLLGI